MKTRVSMKAFLVLALYAAVSMTTTSLFAQAQSAAETALPRLIRYAGVACDLNGKPLTGVVGITFALYSGQTGGAPLFVEMQNVQADSSGHYLVLLGSTKADGLPADIFNSEQARWIGVQIEQQEELPRTLLVSAPYALKAGDAETLGGLPASAFMLANGMKETGPSAASSSSNPASSNSTKTPPPANPDVTGKGTTNYIPMWDSASDIVNSVIFQKSSNIGIGTATPAATLDVNGKSDLRDTLTLFPKSTDKTLAVSGTTFNISSTGKITFVTGQTFPGAGTITGITTASGSGLSGGGTTGTLSLKVPAAGITNAMLANSTVTLNANTAGGLTTPGAMTLGSAYTIGLKPCTSNQILQYSGTAWNCANAGAGTITGVTAGTDLTGGGTSGAVTLNLDTTKVPLLGAANTFTGNQAITGNLTDTGNISATGSVTGQTASFSASNSTQTASVTQTGAGSAMVGTTSLAATTAYVPAILGTSANAAGNYGVGVQGTSASTAGYGLYGLATNTGSSTQGVGVTGVSLSPNGQGVSGFASSTATGATAVGVEGTSNAPNGIGVYGYESGSTGGFGVRGITSATLGIGVSGTWSSASATGLNTNAAGVWGDSATGFGVIGTSDSGSGVAGASENEFGVEGFSTSAAGLYGSSGNWLGVYGYTSAGTAAVDGLYLLPSNSGLGFSNIGVWGDNGVSSGFGVLGSTDDGNALFGKNNTVNHETIYAENDSGFNGGTPVAARFAGPGASTYCYIPRDSADNGSGDLVCTGTKSAAVPVDGNRMVRLYAVEAADNWFEDAGSGQLASGSATVALDQVFAQTVNGDLDYHVFITPNGECEGLYVTNKTSRGFEVHELHGGHSSIAFDYRIMVRRRGFENVRMQDVSADFAQMKRESDLLAVRLDAGKAAAEARPKPHLSPMLNKSPSTARTGTQPLPQIGSKR